MKLVVWNSQGAKWDVAYSSFTLPLVGLGDDIVLMLVESGWAPWVASGDVTINGWYDLMADVTWYDDRNAGRSAFCQAVESKRRYKAFWVPWVGNLDAMKTNSRCSLGSAIFPYAFRYTDMESYNIDGFIRPVIRVQMGKGNRNLNISFTILCVHMISGVSWLARQQLVNVMNQMQQLIPQGTAALVVGDMNVNLLSAHGIGNLPAHWSILNTGVATQQSGGELDYGLLYDPNGRLGGSTVQVIQQYKTGPNQSDHSVLGYDIPLT